AAVPAPPGCTSKEKDMPWPSAPDYMAAIQSPQSCFADLELRQGRAALGLMGNLPLVYSGNFAAVFQVLCQGDNTWAVKCFTREVPDLRQRYQAISQHLATQSRPFMVDFSYLEEGIRVRDGWFPVVKMRWVEGLALNAFV